MSVSAQHWFGAVVAAGVWLSPATGAAQRVRFDSMPEGAQIVCDGVSQGATPRLVDVSARATCTLFLAGHENHEVRVDALEGPVLFARLVPVGGGGPRASERAAAGAREGASTPCGRFSPRGLFVPCFDDAHYVPPPAAPVHPNLTRCGRPDPDTGLITPCSWQSLPHLAPARPTPRRAPCGGVDPVTGLLVPCLDGPLAPRAPRSTPSPCQRNPVTGLFDPQCLDRRPAPAVVQAPAPRPAAPRRDPQCRPHPDPRTGLLLPCL
ncbi:MAG: hypothetical protein JNK72_18645 [Myxococcales bacterium]|nr:hypothetical protein [Myxococcales bacterium]